MSSVDNQDEDPFDLIQKGNAFETASDHWRSAEFYTRASKSLRNRADDLSTQIRRTVNHNNDTSNSTEKKKVVSLYRAQSLEYMYKARYCLLRALQFENEQDRERALEVAKSGSGSLDPLFSMIDTEEIEKRQMIFGILFTGISNSGTSSDAKIESSNDTENEDVDNVEEDATQAQESASLTTECENDKSVPTTTTTSKNEIDNRQQSIESRLVKLDTSILPNVPPPFISGSRSSGGNNTDSQNRLEEIQRGLASLGVTLPDNSRGKGNLISSDDLSPEEQVKLIIEQANDEVRVEKSGSNNDGLIDDITQQYNDDDFIDENDSMFEGFEEDDGYDYDIDALLSKAENLVSGIESAEVREGEGPSELVQIRKVQAILLEARLCLEMIQSKSSEYFLDNKAKKQDIDDKGNKTDVLTGKSSDDANSVEDDNGNNLAARKKAGELIGKAQACLNNLMANWK